jgi:peptidyl-prolyl cis-trans isomerase A (cyclophilin A)
MLRMQKAASVLFAVAVSLAIQAPHAAAAPADPSRLREKAPETFRAKFETTKGVFVVQVHRSWAPHGADRFYNLVKSGYYDGQRFFRVVPNFVVQWGIHGDPAISPSWIGARIPDDPVVEKNVLGTLAFAKAGPGQRTTQVFVNLAKNSALDDTGFAPFGFVVEGMKVVKSLYGGYGDSAPQGRGPVQGKIQQEGEPYLRQHFPKLDGIRKATLL